jgi:iron complex outermembrane recepter protein
VFPLPAITITALGPALTAARAPYAVSATDRVGERLGDPDLSLHAALADMPGIQIDDRYNYSLGDRISIRGFGARAQFGVRGVAVLLDGFPLTLPDGQTELSVVDPAFISRVQAVRGPASALYGNAAGGALLLESAPPPMRGTDQSLRLLGGSNGLWREESSTGTAWSGGGLRLDLSRFDFGGYRAHSRAGIWRGHARAQWQLGSSALEVTSDAVAYNAQNPGSLSDSLLAADRTAAYTINVLQDTGERGNQVQLGARWTRPLGGARLEVAGYGRSRYVDNPIPFNIVDLHRGVGGARVRVSGDGPVDWIVGAGADLQSDLRRNFVNNDGQRGVVTLDQRERVRALAFYGRASAQLGRAGVLAGLRYDAYGFQAIDHLITATNPDDSGRRAMSAWSPTLGVRFTLTAAANLYANIATAFETPTTSELANRPSGAGGFNPDLGPQHTLSVEAGLKGVIAGRARYGLAAYRARITDALVPFEVPSSPGRDFFRNAGSEVHRGVEATLDLASGHGWTASAAYTFTDARFETYRVAGDTLDGNRIPGVAPHRFELGVGYAGSRGSVSIQGRYVSAIMVNDDNTAAAPAYVLVDARAAARSLRLGAGTLRPFVSLENLLDRRYDTSVVVNAAGARYYEPGPGRCLYLGASFGTGPAR